MPYCSEAWWILTNQLPGHMAQYVDDGMGKQEEPQSRDHHRVPPRNNKLPLLIFNKYCSFFLSSVSSHGAVEPKICNIPP